MSPIKLRGINGFTRTPISIRRLLSIQSAAVLIPLVLVLFFLAIRYSDTQIEMIEIRRIDVARSISMHVDRSVDQVRGALVGLSTLTNLSEDDLNEFLRQARALTTLETIETIRLYDTDGKEIASTSESALPSDPERFDHKALIDKALNGQSVVSPIFTDVNGNSTTALLILPRITPSGRRSAIEASIALDKIDDPFTSFSLEDGWVAAVIDQKGRFVARSLSPELYLGKFSRPELIAVATGGRAVGSFENVTHEGVSMGNAFIRSDSTGWTAVVAVPKAALESPLRRSLWLLTGSIGLILGLSLGLSYYFGRLIIEPFTSLKAAADAYVEGRPAKFPTTIKELTGVKRVFDAAVEKAAHLAAVVSTSGDAIMSISLDGRILSWNAGARELFGYQENEIIGQSKAVLVPDELRVEYDQNIANAKMGQSVRLETFRLKRDGTRIAVSLNVSPIYDVNGHVIAISSIAHDITHRKEHESRQRLLIRELTHRSKNLLAIVQSMASQTARSSNDLQAFQIRFGERLQGLSASHDLLVASNWQGADLAELVHKHLGPFAGDRLSAISASGPRLMLSPKAIQALGMALHELSTNAVKHGAYSVPSGVVTIDWDKLHTVDDTRSMIVITWREQNGPPVSKPERSGFGSLVTDRMLTKSLGGEVVRDYRKDGFVWTFTVPETSLTTDSPDLSEPGAIRPQSPPAI
ncbi:MAG: PAS domain S-box protein [Hyphomicrobiaceae bacterium]